VVSFRFVAADGESFVLSNYDSNIAELYDDTAILNYTVVSELYLSHLEEKPSANSFYYGNEITYRFKIADKLSGVGVQPGKLEQANVYLTLKHQLVDRSKPYTSVFEPASFTPNEYYYIKWPINPNAVSGAGALSLTAIDADGNQLPLYKEGNNKQVYQLDVLIGGHIDLKSDHHVSTLFDKTGDKETLFIVTFNLSCQEKPLKDALLRASVSYITANGNKTLPDIAVATNPLGLYQISWLLAKKEVVEGAYRVKFYREIDRLRADVRARANKGISNTTNESEAIFEIDVEYKVDRFSKLPIRSEVAAVLLLGLAFIVVFLKAVEYSKTL